MKAFTLILLLTLSNTALAFCEGERGDRDTFKSNFDTACKAAAAACASGSVFTVVTFGASLIPCGLAVATADNQRRIFKEKESNLKRCEDAHYEQEQLRNAIAVARQNQVIEINNRFIAERNEFVQRMEGRAQEVIKEFERQGYDLTNPDVQSEVNEEIGKIQRQMNDVLKEMEEDRVKEVAGV